MVYFDNLVKVSRCMIARCDQPPIYALTEFPSNKEDMEAISYDLMVSFLCHKHCITKDEAKQHIEENSLKEDIAFFAQKVWQLMTSCQERRINEYEHIGWWEFMDADNRSEEYRTLFVEGLTKSLVAAQAKFANAKTCGDIFLQLVYNIANPTIGADRVLNGPTNQVWLNPWHEYLTQELNVKYHKGCKVVRLLPDTQTRSIKGFEYYQDDTLKTTHGDYYICCMPVEAFEPLVDEDLLKADASLASIKPLAQCVEWMNGVQYYLNKEVKINDGHVLMINTPWALTAISQTQFWKYFDITKCYDGSIKSVSSVDVSDWHTKVPIELKITKKATKAVATEHLTSVLDYDKILEANEEPLPLTTLKSAQECTPKEIIDEVWKQMEKNLNTGENTMLDRSWVVKEYLDRDIEYKGGKESNKEPLLVNVVNSWCLRPESFTHISNLFLAADYVKTYTDLATMEGANEAARRAVNNIIDKSGINVPYCQIWNLHEPFIFAPMRRIDLNRYKKGLAWKLHFPLWIKAIYNIIRYVLGLRNSFHKA